MTFYLNRITVKYIFIIGIYILRDEVIAAIEVRTVKFPNRVQEARTSRKMTREEFALAVGITRQSVRLIEIGEVCPSAAVALRMAKVLHSTVEALFSEEEEQSIHATIAGESNVRDRVFLSALGGSWVARPVRYGEVASISQPVHGTVLTSGVSHGEAEVQLFHEAEQVKGTVFISGCEIALGLLTHFIPTTSIASGAVWFNRSNQKALADLIAGTAHVAAIHYSAAHPEMKIPGKVNVINFASEEMGWVLPKGNPKGFQGAEQLLSGHFRLVNREKGAGARALIDQELQAVIRGDRSVPGYTFEVHGHLAVAEAVAMGAADVGVAHASAAASMGLDFLPLQADVSVLLIPQALIETPSIRQLLDVLHSSRFLRELQAMGPYDTQHTGQIIQN